MSDKPELTPVTLPRLLEELHNISDMRANGELNKDQFEARLGLMVQKARQLFLAANMKEDLTLT